MTQDVQQVEHQTKHPLYKCWVAMKVRCLKPKSSHYDRYGGRGITVCDRWRESFRAFLKDMGEKPGPEYSLDRINNDGNYEPGNCRWATRAEQSSNTCRSLKYESGDNLTAKQKEVLSFLQRYVQENGYPPSIRDIGTQFGIKSPNGVMCHVTALQKKGYIQKDDNVSRGIQLVDERSKIIAELARQPTDVLKAVLDGLRQKQAVPA